MSDIFSSPFYQGYLFKRGKTWPHKWHKRYFMLRGNELMYFKNVKDVEPQGVISLHNAACSLSKKECEFSVEVASTSEPNTTSDNPSSSNTSSTSKSQSASSTTSSSTATTTSSPNLEPTSSNSRCWRLKAPTHKECESWIANIQKAIICATHLNSGQFLQLSTFYPLEDELEQPQQNASQSGTTTITQADDINTRLRRMSLPVHMQDRLEALSSKPLISAPSSSNLVTQRKNSLTPRQSPVVEKKENRLSQAFKRLSMMFKSSSAAPVEEKKEEEKKPTSLVEQYFREQEMMEEQRRREKEAQEKLQSQIPNLDEIPPEIQSFEQLRALIQVHDSTPHAAKQPAEPKGRPKRASIELPVSNQEDQHVNNSNNLLTSSSSTAARPTIEIPPIAKIEVVRKSSSGKMKAHSKTSSRDAQEDLGTDLAELSEDEMLESPSSPQKAAGRSNSKIKALRHYKEEKHNELQNEAKHKRSSSGESDVLSSYSDGDMSQKSEASDPGAAAPDILLESKPIKKPEQRKSIHVSSIFALLKKNNLTPPQTITRHSSEPAPSSPTPTASAEPQQTNSSPAQPAERRKSLIMSLFGKK